MSKLASHGTKKVFRPQQILTIVLMLVPDAIAISLSAITAYAFRFPNAKDMVADRPAIAQFDYKRILVTVIFAWILMLVATGTY